MVNNILKCYFLRIIYNYCSIIKYFNLNCFIVLLFSSKNFFLLWIIFIKTFNELFILINFHTFFLPFYLYIVGLYFRIKHVYFNRLV